MAYADYFFYQNTYKGNKLSEADFDQNSERASDYIDKRTDYVLHKSGIPPGMELRVQKACCALAETIKSFESGGVKSSESVEGYKVSYAVGSQRSADQRMDDTIQLYLADLVKAVNWI
ncbi:MAG: hypothetical protein J6C96_03905 [Oscillospiraceae bacterium]|nr:hypothetical protein [Oscillospiraceae bacterium]